MVFNKATYNASKNNINFVFHNVCFSQRISGSFREVISNQHLFVSILVFMFAVQSDSNNYLLELFNVFHQEKNRWRTKADTEWYCIKITH